MLNVQLALTHDGLGVFDGGLEDVAPAGGEFVVDPRVIGKALALADRVEDICQLPRRLALRLNLRQELARRARAVTLVNADEVVADLPDWPMRVLELIVVL